MTEGGDPLEPDLEPLTPHLGAVLRGVRLSGDPGEETVATVRAAMDRALVVVLEDQELSAAELRDCVTRFGPIFIHHHDEAVLPADGLKEVLEMRKEPDDTRMFGGSDWHADVTFRRPAAEYSFLHAKIIPPLGGDTGFASTIAAFEALSEGMKETLRGLDHDPKS